MELSSLGGFLASPVLWTDHNTQHTEDRCRGGGREGRGRFLLYNPSLPLSGVGLFRIVFVCESLVRKLSSAPVGHRGHSSCSCTVHVHAMAHPVPLGCQGPTHSSHSMATAPLGTTPKMTRAPWDTTASQETLQAHHYLEKSELGLITACPH